MAAGSQLRVNGFENEASEQEPTDNAWPTGHCGKGRRSKGAGGKSNKRDRASPKGKEKGKDGGHGKRREPDARPICVGVGERFVMIPWMHAEDEKAFADEVEKLLKKVKPCPGLPGKPVEVLGEYRVSSHLVFCADKDELDALKQKLEKLAEEPPSLRHENDQELILWYPAPRVKELIMQDDELRGVTRNEICIRLRLHRDLLYKVEGQIKLIEVYQLEEILRPLIGDRSLREVKGPPAGNMNEPGQSGH